MPASQCPACGMWLSFELPGVGQPVRCPRCQTAFAAMAGGPYPPIPGRVSPGGRGSFPLVGMLAGVGGGLVLVVVIAFVVAAAGRSGPSTAGAFPPPVPSIVPSVPDLQAPAKTRAMSADELYRYASPAVVRITVSDANGRPVGFGSGFFVSRDGMVVTNYHVLEGGDSATASCEGVASMAVDSVAAVDRKADLALLQLRAEPKHYLTVSEQAPPSVGSKVFAIGCPEGLTNTLSEGLVSGLRGPADGVPAIQTTAAISHGSSGGPLLAPDGRVVGVTSAVLLEGQNLNFAVPASSIRNLLNGSRIFASVGAVAGDANALVARGRKLLLDGRENDAIKALETALQIDPQGKAGGTARAALVDIYLELGFKRSMYVGYDKAMQCYRRAAALAPNNPLVYVAIAQAYVGMRQYNEAIEACGTAVKLAPHDADRLVDLGNVYGAAARHDDAQRTYFEALQYNPRSARAYYFLAMSCKAQGRDDEAVKWFSLTLQNDPNGHTPYGPLAKRELETRGGAAQ